MTQRGRKSATELALVTPLDQDRPEPPEDLSEAEGEEWLAVTNRLPPGWFPRETHALLSQYCRHVVVAKKLSRVINDMGAESEGYDNYLKMQEREGRAISSLATRMRLTQQSTYDKSKVKPTNARKPWETVG